MCTLTKHIVLSILILDSCLIPFSYLSAQVALQPWVQVYGTVGGQKLGLETRGISPTANLPYKASIYSFGNTGLYTLQTPNDTGAQRVFFGTNMQTGDLNGDGWKDIVMSRTGGSTFVDTVVIYWGTRTGIDTLSPTKLTGSNVREAFGSSMCIVNLIGDSIADLIVTAPQFTFGVFQGRVYIYRGGSPFNTVPSVILNGDSAYYNLGSTCAVGDLNNDGFTDLVVKGGHSAPPRFNYVDIYFGGAAFDTVRGIRLLGPEISGNGLACFDVNGDGVADLLWTNKDSTQIRGDVWVHFGGASFSSVPSMKLLNPTAPTFGSAIANAGDMNGDGYDDVVVAAYSVSQTTGLVFVYGGGPLIDQSFDAAVGMQSESNFGESVSSVGDVTGDGLADIIVGAPNYAFGDQRGYWGIFKGDSTIRVTDVRESGVLPKAMTLYQSYPNPFNPATTIEYQLSKRAFVSLKVYDILGQEIRTLVSKQQEVGNYSVRFDGHGLSSGIYFYEIIVTAQDGSVTRETKKMLLLSERGQRQEDEREQLLLTRASNGDAKAANELNRLQYDNASEKLRLFLLTPDQLKEAIPDTAVARLLSVFNPHGR